MTLFSFGYVSPKNHKKSVQVVKNTVERRITQRSCPSWIRGSKYVFDALSCMVSEGQKPSSPRKSSHISILFVPQIGQAKAKNISANILPIENSSECHDQLFDMYILFSLVFLSGVQQESSSFFEQFKFPEKWPENKPETPIFQKKIGVSGIYSVVVSNRSKDHVGWQTGNRNSRLRIAVFGNKSCLQVIEIKYNDNNIHQRSQIKLFDSVNIDLHLYSSICTYILI